MNRQTYIRSSPVSEKTEEEVTHTSRTLFHSQVIYRQFNNNLRKNSDLSDVRSLLHDTNYGHVTP